MIVETLDNLGFHGKVKDEVWLTSTQENTGNGDVETLCVDSAFNMFCYEVIDLCGC